MTLAVFHKASLYLWHSSCELQQVWMFTSFPRSRTCVVTCRVESPLTCFTFPNRLFYPFHLPSVSLSANFSSHERQVIVNATHQKPLPWPRLSRVPRCLPPLVTQKRISEGPPLALVRAVTYSAAAWDLTSSWLKYPPRPVALRPLPSLNSSFISFHFTIFFSRVSSILKTSTDIRIFLNTKFTDKTKVVTEMI